MLDPARRRGKPRGKENPTMNGRLLLRLRDERRTELVVASDRVRPLKQRLGLL